MSDDFIPVDLRVVILDDLSDGRDSILGGVDVLDGARVRVSDERGQQRHGASARARKLHAAELREHAAPVRARLPDFRLRLAETIQHRLQEYILILYACRT